MNFTVHEDSDVDSYLAMIEGEERRGGAPQPEPDQPPAPAEADPPAEGSMETDD